MSHPRDPRLRRQPVDAAAAAIRLDVATAAMRAQHRDRGPFDVQLERATDAVNATPEQLAAAVQFGTVDPPLTAHEFAAALRDDVPDGFALDIAGMADVEESPEPAPVAPVTPPPPPVSAPEPGPVFSSERRLSWRGRHDSRSLSYGIRPTLAGSAPLTDRMWPVGPVLDQGSEGACVGFAVIDAANALDRVPPDGGMREALTVYKRAQQIDERPGEDYSGTSVLAGMKAGVEAGLFGGYRWAFGTRDIAQAVLQVGPVVVGVPWLSGMYDTGPGGLVQLEGDDQGLGHCLAVVGLRLKGPQGQAGPFFVWQNSWGSGYGDGGLGYIHHRDLSALLHGVGEAAIPTAEAQHVPV